MLKDVIWPDHRQFRSRTEWEPLAFFSKGLFNSTDFDLLLGFFSSSAIRILAPGFATFLYKGGRMRLIINNLLSANDTDAITKGLNNKCEQEFDLCDIEHLKYTLSDSGKHFFECLSWLISKKRIDIKIIKPKGTNGISHTKEGLFKDGVNKVGFNGSCNFSMTALIENIESIDVNCSWDGVIAQNRIHNTEILFEQTFNEENPNVEYLDSEEIKLSITQNFPPKDLKELLIQEQKLNRKTKGYSPQITKVMEQAEEYVTTYIQKIEKMPRFPYTDGPREYQKLAFDNWKENGQKGLFAMATGTGKTLTSLNCLLNIYKKFNFYKAIILVPTITLVDQWELECRKFNFINIVKICSKNRNWRNELDSIKNQEEFNFTGKEPSYIIIATYSSFARESIYHCLVDFSKKATKQMLIIADEAHNMGAGRILDRLDGVKFARRIGLSATPDRQFDEKGNKAIMEFFGCKDNKYTFEYSMQEAIDNNFLCRYYYFPHVVRLTDAEMAEYIKISIQLSKLYNYDKSSFPQSDDILMNLLLKRKRIIHKAKNKEAIFKQILEGHYQKRGNLKYTLVYVPEGAIPDDNNADIFENTDIIAIDEETDRLIDTYTQIVQQISPTTTVRKFVSGLKERNSILDDFAHGYLDVLTSMKCLDEGVDVPRSELAIFCASTGNPRQFIQRRGRILRLHPDKQYAIIHDLVVVPEINSSSECYKMERSLLSSELKRVRDFATMSENADFAYTELSDILSYYDLSLF